jgi:hypothetical protein
MQNNGGILSLASTGPASGLPPGGGAVNHGITVMAAVEYEGFARRSHLDQQLMF